jgi:hypothetical protein
LRLEYMLFVSARRIQTILRGKSTHRQYQSFIAARRIKTSVRKFRVRRAYTQFRAARGIQAYKRCTYTRAAFVSYNAARRIQTTLQECARNVQDIHYIQNYPDNVELSTPATCLCLFCCNKAYPDQLARIYEAGPVQALCGCETNSNRLEGLDGSSGTPSLCKRPYNPNMMATKRRWSCADQDLGSQRLPNILALSPISQTVP